MGAASALAWSKSRTQPSISLASLRSTPAGPPLPTAVRVSSCWALPMRTVVAYSSAATARETARVIAMNGVSRGTSSTGSPTSAAVSTSVAGTSS